ncbi:serine/threonine-protein kinase [Amycolatopsis sp. NPDC004625]|uniref:serine/threonine-protein kinase n=1 Tax=Amycolatopsis sp. NPDC004625 TaxID=3154670 RepID=UPI0033BBE251
MNDDRPEHGDGVLAGRYALGPLIGAGATARVHRAVDRELGREVAVKVYDHPVVAADGLRRARERTLLASIHHPRVVAVYDSGTEGHRPYLVMQLVDGENLAERLLAGPLPAGQVRELGIALADALAHVHARHIVHRDLKPANILLGADGPLITDFGIAHALDATRITGTGLVTGTAAYLAPEQIMGEQPGPPADIYALGLILLECLTAQREFPGTVAESAIARLHRPPRIPEGVPDPLAHALHRMTAREPADRPAAEEVPRLLEAGVPLTTVPPRRGRGSTAGDLVTEATEVPLSAATEGALAAAATEVRLAAAGDSVTGAAEVPLAAAPRARRGGASAAAGVLAAAAAGVLAVVLAHPAEPANSPAPLPEAAPPATSAPSRVTLPPATTVVVVSAQAAKPVGVGVVGARSPSGKPPGGPDKPGGGPHGEPGKGPRRR